MRVDACAISVRLGKGTLVRRGANRLTFERESADWLTFAHTPAACADVIAVPAV
jgi:hypothetical protein